MLRTQPDGALHFGAFARAIFDKIPTLNDLSALKVIVTRA
jgi:hypothetical protein